MSAIHEHPSFAGRLGSQPAQLAQAAPIIKSIPDAWLTALARADRSCCCTAKPAVIAIMPAARGQQTQAELLLCLHHYRESRAKLRACGARIVEGTGASLTYRDSW